MKERQKPILKGRYYLQSSEDFIDGKWIQKALEIDECYFDFTPITQSSFPNGTICYEGDLTETEAKRVTHTKYCHEVDGNSQHLSIDRSIYYEDGTLEAYFEQLYTIEELPNGNIYLNLINEPDSPPPCLRLLIYPY